MSHRDELQKLVLNHLKRMAEDLAEELADELEDIALESYEEELDTIAVLSEQQLDRLALLDKLDLPDHHIMDYQLEMIREAIQSIISTDRYPENED